MLFNLDNREKTIGQKRNELLDASTGKYFCFIDDDDEISPIYIDKIVQAANSGADCASLLGQYYLDGVYYKPFIHDLKIKEWRADENYFYRCPNHLNLIKKECVNGIYFDSVNFGEDGKWSMAINDQQRLKSQFEIKEMLYHYYHRSK